MPSDQAVRGCPPRAGEGLTLAFTLRDPHPDLRPYPRPGPRPNPHPYPYLTLALTLTLAVVLILSPYLKQGLSLAARAFVESDLTVEQEAGGARVTLSKILDWYGADFGADEAAVLGRLQGFLPAESAQHAALGEVLRRPASELQVTYREYDWGGNDATSD